MDAGQTGIASPLFFSQMNELLTDKKPWISSAGLCINIFLIYFRHPPQVHMLSVLGLNKTHLVQGLVETRVLPCSGQNYEKL